MRTGISITLSDANSRRLEGITADRNSAQKHVWRARIVLLSAEGLGTNAIMAAISEGDRLEGHRLRKTAPRQLSR
ncbi:hypothetical protein H5P29_06650 [Aminobacter sp. MDW-2]|jgi:hypothetical protein|nr:hypothetical protein [Aminobacter sp. MDW-2]QNH35574.1 hypothetical protein H5P29_06650 [Aminobacter sp. MDW-2]